MMEVAYRVVAALALAGLATLPAPGAAQTVVLRGRVEDAVTLEPVAGVPVFTADSSSADVTDAGGMFALELPAATSYTVLAHGIGYQALRFDLPGSATARLSVLRLEPAPIELDGIHVVTKSAIDETLSDLARRRNASTSSVRAFDRTRLEQLARFGSVWNFVRRQAFSLLECSSSLSGLCTQQRGWRGYRQGSGTSPVRVCIDGRESWGAISELETLDISAVSLVEIYNGGRDGIRVYTPGFIVTSARKGRNIGRPLVFGC